MHQLLAELQQRRVFRTLSGYAVVCFVILQLTDVVAGPIGIPSSAIRWLLITMVVGIPLVIYLAWVIDLSGGSQVVREGSTITGAIVSCLTLGLFATGAWWVVSNQNAEGSQPANAEFATIAVLPFKNLSGHADQQQYSAGFTQEIWNQVRRIPSLRTIAMTSTLRYADAAMDARQIGAELGADYLLEGSINSAGQAARLSVSLVNAANGDILFGEQFDYNTAELENLFGMYDSIARGIGRALGTFANNLNWETELPTKSMRAYQLNSEAWSTFNADPDRAIDLWREAISLDPNYLDARARLAFYLRERTAQYQAGGVQPARLLEESAAQTALVLQQKPTHAQALYIAAILQMQLDLDFKGAMATFDQAEKAGAYKPHIAIFRAFMLMTNQRHKEAHEVMHEAVQLDPKNGPIWSMYARTKYDLGDISGYHAAYDQALLLEPNQPLGLILAVALALYEPNVTRAKSIIRDPRIKPYVPSFFKPMIQAYDGKPEPLKQLVDEWVKQRETTNIPATLIEDAYWALRDFENHIFWVNIQHDDKTDLYGLLHGLLIRKNYWQTLETWASEEPEDAARRKQILAEYRTRIAALAAKISLD